MTIPIYSPLLRVSVACIATLLLSTELTAQARHAVRGMVLKVDAPNRTVFISHDNIPGVMPAMTMPFEVRNPKELAGLAPGAVVSFTLVLAKDAGYIEGMRVTRYESVEQDPLTARRLRLLEEVTRGTPPHGASSGGGPLGIGQTVPDFTLTDQSNIRVSLSQFRGKVVVVNFIYTSCVLPQFCYRLANHFGVVQRRFTARMGTDLVLFTVTFDPARDTPDQMAEYARQWSADGTVWKFLTGAPEKVRRVNRLFGVDAFLDEGLISHTTRTVVIDRQGAVAASIEGNRHTAAQLGDLVQAVLDR